MKLESLCKRPVVTVDGGAALAEAARLMRAHHVGALVVTGSAGDGRVVSGIVTDRDLVVDALAVPLLGADARVADVASTRLASIASDADASDAIAAMREAGVRRLLVVGSDGRLAGVVSLDDLLLACARDVAGLVEAMQSGLRHEAEADAPTRAAEAPPRVPAIGTAGWGQPFA